MTQTITVDTKTIQKILSRLETLTEDVKEIKKRLPKEPAYGSDTWWGLSDKEAHEDIKQGRYTVVHNKKELKAHLDSLKKS